MANSILIRIAKRSLLALVIGPLVIFGAAEYAFQRIMRYQKARRSKWRELNEDQKLVCDLDESIRGYRRDIAACFARACASSKPEEVEYHLKTAWRYVGNYAAVLQDSAIISGRFFEERNEIC